MSSPVYYTNTDQVLTPTLKSPSNIQNITIIPELQHSQPPKSPITSPKERKFRDILCSIIFFLILIAMAGSLVYFKIWSSIPNILLILRPADANRRVCGLSTQPDFFSVDYSRMLKTDQFVDFCTLSAKVFPAEAISCDLTTGEALNSDKTRQFFAKMKHINTDFSERSVGFSGIGATICVEKGFDCVLQAGTEVFCSADFVMFAEKIDGVSGVKQEYSNVEFEAFLRDNAKFAFLRGFCVPVQKFTGSGVRNDYMIQDQLMAFGIQQCVLDFRVQVENVALVGGFLNYIINFTNSLFQNFVFDVRTTYLQIIYGILCGVGITIIYLVLLKFIVAALVYITIGFLVVSSAFGAYYFITLSKQLKISAQTTVDYFGFADLQLGTKATNYLILGIFIAVLGGIILLFSLLCFKGIRVGIAVIQSSVDCMRRISNVFFLPIFFIVILAIHLFWTGGAAFLYYIGGAYDSRSHLFNFYKFQTTDGVITPVQDPIKTSVFAGYVFMTIWGAFFLFACLEYIVSYHVAHWYFSDHKKQKGVFKNSLKCVMKNLGTVLVTSFITSLVVFIRLIFEYVLRRLEQSNRIANSKIIKAAVTVTRCCLKCIQKIVQWINRNIQVYAAITGNGYFKSLQGSLKLLMGSLFTSLSVKFFSWLFLTFAKLLISIGSGICTWAIIKYTTPYPDQFITGSFLVAVIMFFVSCYTIGIVQLTNDSIYMCYLYEDSFMKVDRENGGVVYAPKKLVNLLQ